ncbi:Aste57867_5852 [Aphanomyces stellatus]|uniref:Aste57867_5852 protein n=1 Tax=Aphanomyces stellatus TaxID=120398 RepID=A0A485KGX8_9STRA|nr:hypothetical protein As57867_005838 [Aphanomyces stellatus]VFT82875.1 Aste57867_5852 [Aphanomyces stellatus]
MQAIQLCQAQSQQRAVTNRSTVDTSHPFFDCFRAYADVVAFLDALVAAHASRVTPVQVATTVQGRAIRGFKLTLTTSSPSAKPIVYVQAGIHPREWISISSAIYAMAKLLESPHEQVFDVVDVIVVPVVNVDGYIFTWAAPANRLWRKNLHAVDLNRNFGPASLFQPSTDTTSETYPGVNATSEPETAGITAFLKGLASDLRGTLDVHTTAGMVLWPLSVSTEPLTGKHAAKMTDVGGAVASAMNAASKSVYTSIPGYKLYQGALYAGTFKDMVYLMLNQTPSLTIELKGDDTFTAPNDSIRPSGDDLVAAIRTFAAQVHNY